MKVGGRHYRTIWETGDGGVEIIDQTRLPHEFVTVHLVTVDDAARAIRDMQVRGAPLIGATAAYGLYLGLANDPSDKAFHEASELLRATRPTAVNLAWALDRMSDILLPLPTAERTDAARAAAAAICDDDVAICQKIGDYGLEKIRDIWQAKGQTGGLDILTHCNAGWLATVDWGTALAPIYKAHEAGLPVHVWVDETRPRNQGAALTAWELGQHGIPNTVIVDNMGGHLMQRGKVDLVITGTDRTTATADVANKIGTYLKALAAHDNGVPFYVALPGPTIDWEAGDGLTDIPIEARDPNEVTEIEGALADGEVVRVRL
ncbi:MAG: S-methyl-5-thioribose-1-phosphate isomerase, partial [Alphaproteobacteria bacterium]|nr:S-methyl-5-thioribose-1-phosphate isomerase [Alphaproteobacteria bacterium]